MKSITVFIVLPLVLISCTARSVKSPIATSTTLSTVAPTREAATFTPTATEFVGPMWIATAVNTPHAIPTALGEITQKESFDLTDERINGFENDLQFTIEILDITIDTLEDVTLFTVKAEGTLTNISDQPVVIGKYWRSGFTMDPQVYWGFTHNGKALEYIQCCVDGWLHIQHDDYIVLQPNEFQRNTWAFSLPLSLRNSDKQEVYLAGEPITITANYVNFDVGYILENEDGSIVTTTDDNGEKVFYDVDMNAWVGNVQSNSITYVFPQ